MSGSLGRFAQEFLSDRYFQVAVGGTCSDPRLEENGVPQGSVMAVTLFLVAVNSLASSVYHGVKLYVYADDIVLVAIGPTLGVVRRKLQSGVRSVEKWIESTGFRVAAEKSHRLHCCNHRHNNRMGQVLFNGTPIPNRKAVKILGITFDNKLNFNTHLKTVKQEIISRARLVRAISSRHNTSNRRTIIQIGKSLILSKLLFGIEMLGRERERLIRIFEPVYNQMIKTASGLLPSSPILSTMAETGELPFRYVVVNSIVGKGISFVERNRSLSNQTQTDVADVFMEITQKKQPKIAQINRVGDREWYRSVPQVDWSMRRKVKAGDSSNKVVAYFNELVQSKYINHETIYTDGSKTEAGVGIDIYSANLSISERLPQHCSIFFAEAAAIKYSNR